MVKYRIHPLNTSVGVKVEDSLNRTLEVLDSLRRNASVYGAELTTPRIQVLIDLKRTRYLFCLNEREEAAKSLSALFEIDFPLKDAAQLFDQWLRSAHPYPEEITIFYDRLIDQLRSGFASSFKKKIARRIEGLVFAGAAMDGHRAGDFNRTRQMGVRAQLRDPRWLYNRPLVSALIETFLGHYVMERLRRARRRIAKTLVAL